MLFLGLEGFEVGLGLYLGWGFLLVFLEFVVGGLLLFVELDHQFVISLLQIQYLLHDLTLFTGQIFIFDFLLGNLLLHLKLLSFLYLFKI